MVTRVICCMCKRSLKVKKVVENDGETIVIVESCRECASKKKTALESEFEKHLCDMLREDPENETLLNIGYEDDKRPS